MDHRDEEEERDLRRLRQELRHDIEDIEAAAGELEDAKRRLVDALVDAGMDGRELHIDLPQRQLVGRVVHVGDTVFTLENRSGATFLIEAGRVVGVRISPSRGTSARVNRGHPRSMLAALRSHAVGGSSITLERTSGAPVRGTVGAASITHAQLSEPGGAIWLVPTSAIVALSTGGIA